MTNHALSNIQLWDLVFTAAGAATAPLMEDNPEYVFPSERVVEAVKDVLAQEGFTDVPRGF